MAKIIVEVAYATPQKQKILAFQVEEGTTVFQGAEQSGIVAEFPEIILAESKMGIFGKGVRNPKEEVLRESDRVEIYRPLTIDPKVARANRAAKTAGKVKAEKIVEKADRAVEKAAEKAERFAEKSNKPD
jgi:putative ubiquitin-RnfH superfamily antitoxin RatB of RatAB toxin-antitoxin module